MSRRHSDRSFYTAKVEASVLSISVQRFSSVRTHRAIKVACGLLLWLRVRVSFRVAVFCCYKNEDTFYHFTYSCLCVGSLRVQHKYAEEEVPV